MKKSITTFARLVVYLVGLCAILACVIMLPELAREETLEKPANAMNITIPFLTVSYLLATPFFIALHQTLKFIKYIDTGDAFSAQSVRTLQNIKICATVFSALIVLATISVISLARLVDPQEEVTFIITIGSMFTLVSTIIAVFITVLQRLLKEAAVIKSENDLIV